MNAYTYDTNVNNTTGTWHQVVPPESMQLSSNVSDYNEKVYADISKPEPVYKSYGNGPHPRLIDQTTQSRSVNNSMERLYYDSVRCGYETKPKNQNETYSNPAVDHSPETPGFCSAANQPISNFWNIGKDEDSNPMRNQFPSNAFYNTQHTHYAEPFYQPYPYESCPRWTSNPKNYPHTAAAEVNQGTFLSPDSVAIKRGKLQSNVSKLAAVDVKMIGGISQTPKRNRRNSEKRKEKSRDAARCRRGKETEIFNDLASSLPLPQKTISQLDKASIMRLTIAYLKIRDLCQSGLKTSLFSNERETKLADEMDCLMQQALDGFLMVLSADGDIIYASESITSVLGLNQVDVMGQSLLDYTHPCDHDELKDMVAFRGIAGHRHAFLRLKCPLSNRGRSVNLRSANYKVVQFLGEIIEGAENPAIIALGVPIPHPSNIEVPLDKQTFITKHTLDMKFTYVDDNISTICGYEPEELVGKSLYELHHAMDCFEIKDAYKILRAKGQVETNRYRFLAKGGGYVWVVTQATVITASRDHKPQNVVCLHYIISGVECRDEILSEIQLNTSEAEIAEQDKPVFSDEPVSATLGLMTSRPKEMNKGYLTFSENQYSPVLKEEPKDLTHLAPSGGSACIALGVPSVYTGFDDVLSLESDGSCSPNDFSTLLSKLEGSSDCEDQFNANACWSKYSPASDISAPIVYDLNISDILGEELEGHNSMQNVMCDSDKTVMRQTNETSLYDSSSPLITNIKTPDPPTPLLSQAAFASPKKKSPSDLDPSENSPVASTAKLFVSVDRNTNPGTSSNTNTNPSSPSMPMDFLDSFLKLEDSVDNDEFDLRAPYIPSVGDVSINSFDEVMWNGSSVSPIPTRYPKQEDCDTPIKEPNYDRLQNYDQKPMASTLEDLLRNGNPDNYRTMGGCGQPSEVVDTGGGFYNPKMGGENLVDPNKVLPSYYMQSDDEIDRSPTYSSLADQTTFDLDQFGATPIFVEAKTERGNGKRTFSPQISPQMPHKKICMQQANSGHQNMLMSEQEQCEDRILAEQDILPTPNAPTMQQLLVLQKERSEKCSNFSGSNLEALLKGKAQFAQRAKFKIIPRGMQNADKQNKYIQPSVVSPKSVQPDKSGLRLGPNTSGTASGMTPTPGNPRRGRDPLLLMSSNCTIPTLLDLTQQDYEVNAPATNSLLHGVDLLMALDQ